MIVVLRVYTCYSIIIKKRISYYRIKQEFHIYDDGLSLREMISFLNKFNIKTRILKIDNILNCGTKTFYSKQFPCIGIEELSASNHYIVIYSIKKVLLHFQIHLTIA